jgi:hypothetical protein
MSVAPRVLAIAIAVSVLCHVTAHAQTGTIAGTVVEEGTLTPLFGTDPNAVRVGAFGPFPSGRFVAGGATDATGHYQISLPPGSYRVKITAAPGYVAEWHDNVICIAADCPVTASTEVVVTADTTTTVDFALQRAGSIAGTVRRAADGSPIGGLQVQAYNSSTSLISVITFTNSDGTYRIGGLAPGSYFARTTGSVTNGVTDVVNELYRDGGDSGADSAWIASGTPIAVTAGSITAGIDFSLDGASISGTVVADGSGLPLADMKVTAYFGEAEGRSAITNVNGHYTIVGLPAGRVRVRTSAEPANYIDEWQNGVCIGCAGPGSTLTVNANDTISGVDFSLAAGGTITGTIFCDTQGITSPGEAAPQVKVFNSAGQVVRSPPPLTNLSPRPPCGTGSPATYSVAGLPSGTYFVLTTGTSTVSIKGRPQNGNLVDQLYGGALCVTTDCDVRRSAPVAVTAGTTTSGINFVPPRGGRFEFLVETWTSIVKVYDARGVEVINAVGGIDSSLNIATVAGLPPGTYYVTVDGLVNGIACLDCPPTAGRPIVVGPDLRVDGQLSFATLSRRISGTITSSSGGAPLSTITVELLAGSGKVVRSAITDMFGHYTVDRLAAGTYYARTLNDRGFVDQVYLDAACGTCDPRMGTPIVVPSSTDVTGIDFALAPGGIVSGVVSDTAGIALERVMVSLYAGTSTFVGAKTTRGAGKYRLTLPAGTYRAVAKEGARGGAEIYADMPCTSTACDPSSGTPITVTTGAITKGIDFTLTSCSAMTLSPSILATGVSGRTYRQVFSAIGGTGPYVFDVTDGALPLGLTLNGATGRLEGTPVVAGQSAFRVSVLDTNGCATDRVYTLDVQGCTFTLSPTSATVPAAGGTVTVTIADACGSQSVFESASWIAVQSSTPEQVTLTIDGNAQGPVRTAAVAIGRRAFEVRQAGATSEAPFGSLDLPVEGAQVSGATPVTGWVLDDLEVVHVRIYRDHVAGEPVGLTLLGTAAVIPGARPDVQAAYPGMPWNDRAGFGFMVLTNTFPNQGNGTFRVHAVAEDADGHTTLLGSRTIVGNNATAQVPFGTIDTPGQAQTVAGSGYVNFGWALTPQPAMIPTDGSTIQVIVDGAPVGNASYNFFRPDVSNTFPGLANSSGPVGYRTIDTTALAEGLHTISWTVTDTRPATAGLGSRFFHVVNSADAQPSGSASLTASEEHVADAAKPIGVAAAPDVGRHAASLGASSSAEVATTPSMDAVLVQRGDGPKRRVHTSADGAGMLTLAPMERIELTLGATDQRCPATWAGYLVKDGVLSDLPVGTSLDASGTFYWQTGPGFAGRFPLLFVRTDCRGDKQQLPVVVTIATR